MRILVVDDKTLELGSMVALLEDGGHRIVGALGGEAALEALEREPFDVVVTDLKMPGIDGLELLRRVRQGAPETDVILVTAYGAVATAVEAMRLGATTYIIKGTTLPDELCISLDRLAEVRRMRDDLRVLREEAEGLNRFHGIVGRSRPMREVFALITSVAASDVTVLVRGEHGTGKELVTRAIHRLSARSKGPYVPINCSAIPESLIESELFGHCRGAFTDARAARTGYFEQADGGTILLDEVGDLPASSQPKLLRVLEQREIRPLGSERAVQVDVRIIAATNRDLEALIEDGLFRPDLYYRLNTITIALPPLRERRDDVPLLVEHLLRLACARHGRSCPRVRPETLERLTRYGWPGNVRELDHAIQRALVVADSDEITSDHLPAMIREELGEPPEDEVGDSLVANERHLIRRVLQEVGWNIHEAARRLGISRQTLYSKVDRHGLTRPRR